MSDQHETVLCNNHSDDSLPSQVPYTPLSVGEINAVLDEVAHPYSIPLHADARNALRADGVNFQPCKSARTEDRYIVEQIEVSGRLWTLTGVFDGHLGEATVEHVVHHLPLIIRRDLNFACSRTPGAFIDPFLVSSIMRSSISSFDEAIAADVINLFPGGCEGGLGALESLDDDAIRAIVNDYDNGLQAYAKAKLCMCGTTALVALVDEVQENLWVANLGDCQAVLATREQSGEWSAELLTSCHNGSNPRETERVLETHPSEPECIIKGRVLGALAPFRTIGDQPFKQPPAFTRRILYNLEPTYSDIAPWEAVLLRNLTPPYISNEAEVVHRRLTRRNDLKVTGISDRGHPCRATVWEGQHFLILSTDGLSDLYEYLGVSLEMLPQASVDAVVSVLRAPKMSGDENDLTDGALPVPNLAKSVLLAALGGEDTEGVSRMITAQLEESWVDDTTVVVQLL